MPRHRFGWGASLVALTAFYAFGLVATFVIGGETGNPASVAGPIMVVLGVVGLAAAAHASRRRDRHRRAWQLVAVSFTFLLATLALFIVPDGKTSFPAPADAARTAFVVALIAASYCFPTEASSLLDRRTTTFDALTVVAGGSMMLWYLLVGPVLAVHGAAAAAAAMYAVADLVLLFGFARVLLRGTAGADRRPVALLASAVLPLTASDAFLGYSQAHQSHSSRTSSLQLACILTMAFLMAAAAVERCRDVGGRRVSAFSVAQPIASKLPYLAVVAGWSLMVIAASKEQVFPWTGLVSGGLAITGFVVLRQVTVQKAIEAAAATDELTGLASRSRFNMLLAEVLRPRTKTPHAMAVLLMDMNGFKQVNDSLGHEAGDRLLSHFGLTLSSNIRKSDIAGRLGGDEFVVVLHDIDSADVVEAFLRRITVAVDAPLLIHGEPVRASVSIGIALTRSGDLTPSEVLRRADLAMYDAKRKTGQMRWAYWEAGTGIDDERLLHVE